MCAGVSVDCRGVLEDAAHVMRGASMGSGRVVGLDQLIAKRSAVAADGAPLEDMIDGVRFRPTRPVPHEDGTLAEVARMAWDEVSDPIVQVHVTTTLPGRVRAWSVHQTST